MPLKMPERGPGDGPVAVRRPTDGEIAIAATTDGVEGCVVMSEYNAWRVFGMLSMMLGIPLPPATGKAIKLG